MTIEDLSEDIALILHKLSNSAPAPVLFNEKDERVYQTLQWLKDNDFVYFPNDEKNCVRYQFPGGGIYETVTYSIMASVTIKGLNLLNTDVKIEGKPKKQSLIAVLGKIVWKGSEIIITAVINSAISSAFGKFS